MILSKRTGLVATFVGFLAVVVIIVLAGNTPEAHSSSASDQFAVLKPVTGDLEVPDAAEGWLAMTQASVLSNPEVSDAGIAVDDAGNEAWVLAAGDQICAYDLGSGNSLCGQLDQAASGQIFVAVPDGCDHYRVMGLMPDGVGSLALDENSDGTTDSILEVTDNVYYGTLDPVETTLSGGEGSIVTTLPLDWYAADNEAC